jgi:D-alanine-D-alanine ligase
MGGTSAEREVSKATGVNVCRGLAGRHTVKPVEILADGRWCVPDGFLGSGISQDPEAWLGAAPLDPLRALAALRDAGIQVVFNALHGPGGEDGSFQGFLRHAGVAFTGPDVTAAAVTMDKWLAKQVLRASGVATPSARLLPGRDPGSELSWREIAASWQREVPAPWVVKPNALGSSVGVEMFDGIEAFVCRAAAGGGSVWCRGGPGAGHFLLESRVRGRELTCGVLELDGEPKALPPIEIRPRESAFFDYHAKYTPGATEEICPAPLTRDETRAVQELAQRVHGIFGCGPLSRTDLFLETGGGLTVLEVNTLPGMTATSLIPQAAAKAGIPMDELLEEILRHGLRRQESRQSTVDSRQLE